MFSQSFCCVFPRKSALSVCGFGACVHKSLCFTSRTARVPSFVRGGEWGGGAIRYVAFVIVCSRCNCSDEVLKPTKWEDVPVAEFLESLSVTFQEKSAGLIMLRCSNWWADNSHKQRAGTLNDSKVR